MCLQYTQSKVKSLYTLNCSQAFSFDRQNKINYIQHILLHRIDKKLDRKTYLLPSYSFYELNTASIRSYVRPPKAS